MPSLGDVSTDYTRQQRTSMPDARNQVASVTAAGAQPHPPPRQTPSVRRTSLFSKSKRLGGRKKKKNPAYIRDIFADIILDILTKMCTEINPQRNILNNISRPEIPEHFKQAPKFGDLSIGITKACPISLLSHLQRALNRGDNPPPQKKNPHAFFVSQTWHNPSCLMSCVTLGNLSNHSVLQTEDYSALLVAALQTQILNIRFSPHLCEYQLPPSPSRLLLPQLFHPPPAPSPPPP